MAKISDLPLVDDTNGTEAVLIVKDGVARRASIEALAGQVDASAVEGLLDTRVAVAALASNAGAAMVYGTGPAGRLNVQQIIDRRTLIPFAELGGKADYDPVTGAGTDDSGAFALAKTISETTGVPVGIQLPAGASIKVSTTIRPWSGMRLIGDDGYTPTIYGIFTSSGKRVIGVDPTDPTVLKNIQLRGFTVYRGGVGCANPEHGVLLDNMDGAVIDIAILAVPGALGGALGLSAFYPENRPSKNVVATLHRVTNGGNFALQFGNVDGGVGRIRIATNCHREVIGLEPYALGRLRFQGSAVSGDVLSWPAHGLTIGYPLIYSREGATAFSGLAAKSNYYFAVPVDANSIRLANSKEEAIAGTTIAFGVPAASTDWHAFIKCGILRNVTIAEYNLDTGDVTAGGSGTGTIIITATSGGYHEGVTVHPGNVIERNPTSGTFAVGVYGAKGWVIDGLNAIGQKTCVVRAGKGTVNEISDPTGDISPKQQNGVSAFGLQVVPDGIIKNVVGRQFKGIGIQVDGDVIIENCDLRSNVATGPAITVTDDSLVNYRPFVRGCVVQVPSATPIASVDTGGNVTGQVVRQQGCRNVNDEASSLEWISKRRVRQVIQKTLSAIAAAGTPDADKTALLKLTSADPSRSATTYSGRLRIAARQVDSTNTNLATYELSVIRKGNGLTPEVVLLSSQGLTAGSGTTWPSFVFGINAENALAVAAVGSTATTRPWYFDIESSGDLMLS